MIDIETKSINENKSINGQWLNWLKLCNQWEIIQSNG